MVELLSEKFNSVLATLPFFFMSIDGKAHLNKARITEGVMIAVFAGISAGIFTSYVTLQVIKAEFENVKQEQKNMRVSVDDMKKDLYILKGKVEK